MNKILILSASAGAGHVSAGEAFKDAALKIGAAKEVLHLDTLQYTNKVFRRIYSQTYIDLVNKAPELLGWIYDFLDKPWKNEKLRLAFDHLNTKPFRKLLEQEQPDLLICTHFLPAEIISWLKYKHRLSARLAVVVTDFDLHAMWLCRHCERYFVALEETRQHLIELGVAADKISVTGIPIKPVFAESKDKRTMRLKHGLKPEKLTILVSAGGFGVGPIDHLMSALLKLKTPAQVIAICGKSRELHARISRLVQVAASSSAVSFKVIGFTREMDELMAASDVMVGKPGGLTTSEALAKGLVLVIVNPIPGQEERNADHLLEEGAAIRCNNLPVLSYKIDRLVADKERFEKMRRCALALGKPRAAFQIIEELVKLG